MRETEYVELAFWSGWVEGVGGSLNHQELLDMTEAMRQRVACMVQEYLSYLGASDANS